MQKKRYIVHSLNKRYKISKMSTNITCCERSYILGLCDGGMAVKDIAEKVGRSLSGVYEVIQKRNVDHTLGPKVHYGGKIGGKKTKISCFSTNRYTKELVEKRQASIFHPLRLVENQPILLVDSNKIGGKSTNFVIGLLQDWLKFYQF